MELFNQNVDQCQAWRPSTADEKKMRTLNLRQMKRWLEEQKVSHPARAQGDTP